MFDLDEIAAEDRIGWSAVAVSARLLELLSHQREVAAEVLRCAGEWDAMAAWAEDGSLSAASWLSQRAAVTTHDARELVRSARLVQGHQSTAKALAAGDISPAHVHVAARAARHVEDLYGEHEDGILDAARVTSPEDFKIPMEHWRSLAENLVGREPSEARIARRHLHISQMLDSMARIDGWVDAETGARFAAALDALEPPDPVDAPEPPRSLSQRRADALGTLVGGTPGAGTTLAVVVDLDRLQGRFPTDLVHTRCELLGGDPIDHATAVRLACDAAVSRVLMRGTSTILDLGRATPVVSRAQRRALAIRDGGCVEPGCAAPPDWCDAHHKLHWILGGRTDLDNLELRCRRHHVAEHARAGRSPPSRPSRRT
jgi:hypothetical protein